MVRHYKRKTDRQKWSSENMERAVEAVISREMGFKKAAIQFQVPSTTLERYVKKKRENAESTIDKTSGKYQCVFNFEQERELVDYLKDMQKRLFGFSVKELRRMAYQLAEKNQCKHSFNKNLEMAGEDWATSFMSRHTDLSLRKPEATSGARAMGFNKVAVSQFFKLLTAVIDEHKLTAARIYNCDETGITVVPKQFSKIIANRGQRQVGVLTSAERGNTVTAEICCSAAGSFMPPMLIFPRKRKQQEFEVGLPAGGWSEANESGWMTADIFYKWFQAFVQFSNAKKECPVLLLLDGHASHTKNLAVIELARDKGVILLCFPPHCSHRLQPLDVAFMRPLSSYYEDEVRRWLRSNPGKVVTLHQISALFAQAFLSAANMRTGLKGFEKTGIWPNNINVFTDADYLPAAVTDIPLVEAPATRLESQNLAIVENINVIISENVTEKSVTDSPLVEAPAAVLENQNSAMVENIPVVISESIVEHSVINNNSPPRIPLGLIEHARNTPVENEPKPGCSWMPHNNYPGNPPMNPLNTNVFQYLSPEQIMPIPKVKVGQKRTARKRGKTAILTASPYKTELEESAKKVQKANEAKAERAKRKLVQKETNTKGKERVVVPKKMKKPEKKRKKTIDEEDSSEEEDVNCLYCNDQYSKSIEGWCSCMLCKKWAHNSCAGIDSDDDDQLICDLCKP